MAKNSITLDTIISAFNGKTSKEETNTLAKLQNATILTSDPAFLSMMENSIFTYLLGTPTGLNSPVSNSNYIEPYRDDVAAGNLTSIENSIKNILKALSDSSYKTTDEIPVKASEVLALKPPTRALLGFDSVNFYDEGGVVDAAVFTTADKVEQKLLKEANKETVSTYTGADITTSISIGKVITNIDDLKTISYSTHRDVVQVRSCNNAYATGVSRGGRTIAGSLICTVRLKDPMTNLDPQRLVGYDDLVVESDADLFKEQMLPDQYPLFDMMIIYQNEYGDASAITIFGMAISDTGQTSSVHDTETEIQYTYTAMDINPLRKIKFNPDGTEINPFKTQEYLKRKKRIIEGNSIANDPYATPAIVTKFGNISHLDFVL